MRAAVLNSGRIVVRDDVAEPEPGVGEALVRVRACGICGSDLHFAEHGARMLALADEMARTPGSAASLDVDLGRDVYMGHEFAAEVLAFGPDTEESVAVGSLVTAFPVLVGPRGVRPIVYSNTVKAGYGERMLLTASMLLEVPNGLPAHHAALTEPIAVGAHAVIRSGIHEGEGALVLGCGPIGLAVIAALRQHGIAPIVAADLSTARRELAVAMGAHEVVDPRSETSWSAWNRAGQGKPLVVFEAIGVPGILNDVLRSAPSASRVLVVGVCMDDDTVNPFFGVTKELTVLFSFGYTPEEFARSLAWIAQGEVDVGRLVTARVPLDETPWAFAALRDPEEHCKIIVEP